MASTSDSPALSNIVTFELPSFNGRYESIVHLQLNSDPTKPPTVLYEAEEFVNLNPPRPNRRIDKRNTHIIISRGSGPGAGSNQAPIFFRDNVASLINYEIGENGLGSMPTHVTESETSILETVNKVLFPLANQGKTLRIILLSGDGGIVDLVNGFSSKPRSEEYVAPKIVILPLGTANALFHSTFLSSINPWGLAALTSTTYKPLPTFTATFSPGARLLVNESQDEEELPKDAETGKLTLHGAVVASWGMHAALVADSDTTEYRKFGVERFKMAAKDLLYPSDGSPPHAYQGTLSYLKPGFEDWTRLEEKEHAYVLATLVSNLEPTFTISPESKPLDGSMHLVHFGPRGGDDVMRVMGLAYQGGLHVKEEDIRYESIDGLRVQFREEEGRWRRVCIDGKIVRIEQGGWMEVRKHTGKGVLDVVVLE